MRSADEGGAAAPQPALVMFIGLLVVLVFSAAIFSLLIGQVTQLVDRLPEYVDSVTVWLNDTVSLDIDTAQIQEELGDWDSIVENYGDDVLSGALGFTSSIVGFIFQMLTVGLFLFYILADTPKLRAAVMRNLPPERQKTADQITTITIEKVGGYVYSRGLLAAVSAVFHFVVFLLIGLPYPLALALWVGVVSQFVPTVGTYLAGVVPVVVALLEDPIDALWVLIAIIVYQQIENYLISPRITANTMDLHPAVAFGSAIFGAQLLGGLGALLALPVAATVTALVQTYTHRYDLIDSDRMESPEQYEARMAAKKAEKDKRKGAEGRRGSARFSAAAPTQHRTRVRRHDDLDGVPTDRSAGPGTAEISSRRDDSGTLLARAQRRYRHHRVARWNLGARGVDLHRRRRPRDRALGWRHGRSDHVHGRWPHVGDLDATRPSPCADPDTQCGAGAHPGGRRRRLPELRRSLLG